MILTLLKNCSQLNDVCDAPPPTLVDHKLSKPLYGVWNTYQHSRGYYLDPPVWPLMMFFAISHLCEPPKDSTRIEGQHPRINSPHSLCYTGEYKDKHHIKAYSHTGYGRCHLPDLIFSNLNSNLLECTATLKQINTNLRFIPWVL